MSACWPGSVCLVAMIEAFCDRWHVEELTLFGSDLRDDFGADSDIDELIQFKADHTPSLFGVDGIARIYPDESE